MILVRYLLGTLLKHMFGVFGVLAGALWVFNFLDQMVDVGSGNYTVSDAGIYALSLVPTWFSEFAGMAAFLGALTSLGKLQQDSELTVMRAAGWSIARIAAVAAIAGASMAGAGFLAGETIAPQLEMAAQQRKDQLRFGPEVSASASGIWTRDERRIVGFDRANARGVTVLTLDADGQLVAYADARTIRRIDGDSIAYDDYRESRLTGEGITPIREDAHVERSDSAAALLALSSEAAIWAPTMRQIFDRVRDLRAAGLEHADLDYELHDRIARFLMGPALVILAALSVVGPMRSSRRGSRVMLGVLIGFGLSMSRSAAHSMVTVFGLSPVAMAWAPAVVLLIAVAVLARTLRPRLPSTRVGSPILGAAFRPR